MTADMTLLFLLELLIHVLRLAVLLFLPVRELLRWRGWRAAVYLTAAILASTVVTASIWLFTATPYARLFSSCFGTFLTFLICRFLLKSASSPVMFAVLMQASYGDCVNLVVRIAGLLLGFEQSNGIALRVAALLLTALTLPFMYALMCRYVRPMLSDRGHSTLCRTLWLIPACFYIVFRLGVYPGYFPMDSRVTSPWMLLLLVWPVVTGLIYIVSLRLLNNTIEHLALRAQLEEDETLLALQEELYGHQRADIDQARTARHDMRHHLLVVEGLLDAGRPEEADRYLSDAIASLR